MLGIRGTTTKIHSMGSRHPCKRQKLKVGQGVGRLEQEGKQEH